MKDIYDVVVLGAGSAGLTSAVGLAKAGKKVLLVEREHLGGECTNSGCVPSKALLHFAKNFSGSSNQKPDRALTYLREKREEILKEESREKLEALGLKVVLGEAKFQSPCSLEVSDITYHFKKAIIATGSSPRIIPLEGVDPCDILTNQNIFELDTIPKELLIIGSGPIGMELGQAFALLGSQVTIATQDKDFAKLEDPLLRPEIERSFTNLGIKILKETAFIKAENKTADFKSLSDREKIYQLSFDKILLAIGRVPNLPPGLKQAKIDSDEFGIKVDSLYKTTNKSIFAVGDVANRLKFTHTASDTARSVVAQIVSRGWLTGKLNKAVPKVTYIKPELAQVGLSYEEACQRYREKSIYKISTPLASLDRAVVEENNTGQAIVIVKRVTGEILGANIYGERAGEIIAIFTLAIDRRLSLWKLRDTIYAYPSYSLVIQKLGDLFLSEQIKNLRGDLWQWLKSLIPKVVAIAFWFILIGGFQFYKITNDLSYADILFSLYQFFTISTWGPIIYILLYTLRPLVFFPATLLTALAGALFGLWWGLLYTVIATNLSANFAYVIGRYFGKGLNLEHSFLGRYVNWIKARPFESILFMRLFYVPFDLANYGAGVLRVPWLSYAIATAVGIFGGSTIFVILGASVSVDSLMQNGITFDAFNPWFVGMSVTIFIISLFLSKLLKVTK